MKERIEKILNDKKITQAEFADFIGVNRSSITHIMTGRNKTSDTVVARTCITFPDINPLWLSDGTGEMYKTFAATHVSGGRSYPTEDIRELEDENLFTNTNRYNPENQYQNPEISRKTSSPESDIQFGSDNNPAISTSRQEKNKKENPIVEKQIRKIVFFYADKTFEEYYPE